MQDFFLFLRVDDRWAEQGNAPQRRICFGKARSALFRECSTWTSTGNAADRAVALCLDTLIDFSIGHILTKTSASQPNVSSGDEERANRDRKQ